jgi:hypothetical protein
MAKPVDILHVYIDPPGGGLNSTLTIVSATLKLSSKMVLVGMDQMESQHSPLSWEVTLQTTYYHFDALFEKYPIAKAWVYIQAMPSVVLSNHLGRILGKRYKERVFFDRLDPSPTARIGVITHPDWKEKYKHTLTWLLQQRCLLYGIDMVGRDLTKLKAKLNEQMLQFKNTERASDDDLFVSVQAVCYYIEQQYEAGVY